MHTYLDMVDTSWASDCENLDATESSLFLEADDVMVVGSVMNSVEMSYEMERLVVWEGGGRMSSVGREVGG